MPIDVNGRRIGLDDVAQFLRECADNLPGDYKPDSQSWGLSAAAIFFSASRGTPEGAAAISVLQGMVGSSDSDHVRFAAEFLPRSP